MVQAMPLAARSAVALLAEGVDRNSTVERAAVSAVESPSSRRAWIEILNHLASDEVAAVALLAEGVDRNFSDTCRMVMDECRPPRGGRG